MNEFAIAKIVLDSLRAAINNGAYPKSHWALLTDSWGFQDFWMFLLTVGLFIGVIVQLKLTRGTIKEMEKAANIDVGSLEIDFRIDPIVHTIASEIDPNKKRFKVNFSLIPSGKAMVRVISTRFDFGIKDFMLMERDWNIRLKSYEAYAHKLLKPDEHSDLSTTTAEEFTDGRVREICAPESAPFVSVKPLCLYGTVKYHNSVGETWVKPFIFRFEWDASGKAIPIPWSNAVELEKVYPTRRTWWLKFHLDNPRLSRMLQKIGIKPKW